MHKVNCQETKSDVPNLLSYQGTNKIAISREMDRFLVGDKTMKNEYGIYTTLHRGLTKLLVSIVIFILLTQVLGDNPKPRPSRPRQIPVPEAQKERIAGQIASNYGGGPFQLSLETKEHADFLLTPALLVQEAICDDIIITYPTE
ncbi:MAG: hypothetical protein A2Z25_00485 [Planctomycetes bacterium RBG_16_55_9]|nr:MAG: hypothetical protein A2Z25_00485 [Planctomycetes bacterium RBG_16_55_9]